MRFAQLVELPANPLEARTMWRISFVFTCLLTMSSISVTGLALTGLALTRLAFGEPPDFRKQVAPIIAKRCLECHSSGTAEGGLDLAQKTLALKGGESGKAIEAGDPANSLLWQMIEDNSMPKDRSPLSDEEKQTIREWLAAGAEWPIEVLDPFEYSDDKRGGYDWWSLQPVTRPEIPTAIDSYHPANPIDRFVHARLHAVGLQPAPTADARTLLRRLYFDLIGLPPSPEEVQAFVKDPSPEAYSQVVERLLNSTQYGERWARHWLDVVRFGETQGYERNLIRENAWQYRDWVIRAFNEDLPYDDFVRYQIAGDVLKPDDFDAMIATGYHVCGTWDQVGHVEGSETMRVAARWDHIEDLVGTLGQGFLGLTINCARCHSHKFDPISHKDYYQVAAALAGVTQEKDERAGLKLKRMESTKVVEYNGKAHVIVPRQPPVFHVLARGDMRKPLDEVTPRGLDALARGGLSADFGLSKDAPEGQRRLKLAEWIADDRNPLTARVIVNRLWHYHFGRGIVDTPSDFGFNGGRPFHPELLDWLSRELVEPTCQTTDSEVLRPWSLKHIHRLMVLSSSYRQAALVDNPKAIDVDADNRLLWRFSSRRLEGEAVRDAALQVAGALNPQVGGPSFRDMHFQMKNNAEFTDPTGEFSDEVNRRTIYRLWARSGANPMLQSLDCPDPSVAAPQRTKTITPLQALSLLNNATMEKCAQRMAERLSKDVGDEAQKQIERAYWLAFSRAPSEQEIALSNEFVKHAGLTQFCLVLLNTNEFLTMN